MTEKNQYDVSLGKISEHLSVDEFVVLYIENKPDHEDEDDLSGFVIQGHLTNLTETSVDDISIDVSYYDSTGKFLGLDKSGILDIDEIEPKCTIPFEFDLEIPSETSNCILNAYAKKMPNGFFMRWYYRGKG